jgi:hypothetical protein
MWTNTAIKIQQSGEGIMLIQPSWWPSGKNALGAVHKLRHPLRGGGGVFKKMTLDDIGGRGGQSKDDR